MGAEAIAAFVLASALLSLAPGPDNIFVFTLSSLHGWRAGVTVILGLCTGLLVHTAAVALGVAALLKTSSAAFLILKLLGASYLLYLAWGAFRASAMKLEEGAEVPLSSSALYRRGVIMNVTNPKVAIFFLAFLPQFVSADAGSPVPQIFFLGLLFVVVGFSIFFTIALFAGVLSGPLRRSPAIQVWLNRAAGFVFVVLALNLMFAEL